jgi:predicted HAD superfamily Cof-like phosphohydrolase
MNLSELFKVVHKANMDKKDLVTGRFIRRESDGKIVKPEGWRPPDIEGEIKRQMKNGSWNL